MKIAIFGGSFDPFHKSHLEIINWCKDILNFDEVWIVLAYQNPFKTNVFSTPEQRLDIITMVSDNLNFVKIINFELKRAKPTPTYLTVKYLKKKYKEHDFTFIVGMDILKDIEKWNNFNKLIKMVKFLIFKRENYNYEEIANKYNFEIINFSNSQLSSTDLRNQKRIESQLEIVNNYVKNNFLYYQNKLDNLLTPTSYQVLLQAIQYFELLFSPFSHDYLIYKNVLLTSYVCFNFDTNIKNKNPYLYLKKSYQHVEREISVKNDFNQKILLNLKKLSENKNTSFELKKLLLVLSYANTFAKKYII
ncbi:nicotinate (nicotinamide) nucleotide adenylyltransferase [Spiroplasma endosymbiont of Aspidapion aeneum]|uniref:nicotinate (nicotinamide) nucleotide adenylyltransferase n=1 Tax=Spiroplasma endosymbiont of Aspidapion aeneum TaxID=3066276 RepID=UPI00313C6629